MMVKEVTILEEDVALLDEISDSFQILLYNDDVNTFDWVIECLVKICKHDELQAEQCAMLVHYKGKAVVKNGSLEEMKVICQALCDCELSAVVE
jgi:ATP-dependent Clp protease adaptor protein ClpS